MAKIKHGKRKLLSRLEQHKVVVQKTNPFDVAFQKRKKTNYDTVTNGTSKDTQDQDKLLREYRNMNKSNAFIDSRLNEKGSKTESEKLFSRFALERKNRVKFAPVEFDEADADTSVFNAKKRRKAAIEEREILDAEFVERANFGGFDDSDEDVNDRDDKDGGAKGTLSRNSIGNRKDAIGELILRSKQQRLAQQEQREKALDLTDQLDQRWRSLLREGDAMQSLGKSNSQVDTHEKPSDYDILLRQLQFEATISRNRVHELSDGLKSSDIADAEASAEPKMNVYRTGTSANRDMCEIPADAVAFLRNVRGKTLVELRTMFENMLALGDNLEKQFLQLVRYYDYLSLLDKLPMKKLNLCIEFLRRIEPLCPEFCERCMKSLLGKHTDAYNQLLLVDSVALPMNSVFVIKLIAALYPSTDLWHPVVSPAVQLAVSAVSRISVRSIKDVIYVLVLCEVLVDCLELSHRYVPEVLACLLNVLYLSLEQSGSDRVYLSNFPQLQPFSQMLVVRSKSWRKDVDKVPSLFPLLCVADPELKLAVFACIKTCLKQLTRLAVAWKDAADFRRMFEPVLRLVDHELPVKRFPTVVQMSGRKLRSTISTVLDSKIPERKKIGEKVMKEFKYLEPKLDTDFDPERKKKASAKQKLVRAYKNEFRGAVRALRKNATALSRAEYAKQVEHDTVRNEKTKKLLQSLMQQESEYKKMKKQQARLSA